MPASAWPGSCMSRGAATTSDYMQGTEAVASSAARSRSTRPSEARSSFRMPSWAGLPAGKEPVRERSGIGRTADMLHSKLEIMLFRVPSKGCLGPSVMRERRS